MTRLGSAAFLGLLALGLAMTSGAQPSRYDVCRDEAQQVLTESMAPIADSNRSAHTKTLLCLDQPDGAADLMVERLHDPEESRSLILAFSQMSRHATAEPFLAELENRGDEVRARPDVRAAFDAVGRAIAIDGARTYWGNF